MKKLKLLSMATISAIAVSSAVQAADLSTKGQIKVRNAIAVAENQVLNFGTIEKPVGSAVDVAVTTGGVVDGGDTTATHIDTADVKEGKYTISGSFTDTIDITAADNANVAGMSFTEITGLYDSNSADLLAGGLSAQAAPGAGTELKVGGILNVATTVTEGDYEPGFTITVNYN